MTSKLPDFRQAQRNSDTGPFFAHLFADWIAQWPLPKVTDNPAASGSNAGESGQDANGGQRKRKAKKTKAGKDGNDNAAAQILETPEDTLRRVSIGISSLRW